MSSGAQLTENFSHFGNAADAGQDAESFTFLGMAAVFILISCSELRREMVGKTTIRGGCLSFGKPGWSPGLNTRGKIVTLKLSKIGVVVATVATASPALAAPQCPSLAEANAERVRILQTELMVAALKCRARTDLGLFDKYNSFVRTFTPELVAHGKALTNYFQRSYGSIYRQKMDKYITSLANTVSIASDQDPQFCETTSQRADIILAGAGSVTLANVDFSDTRFTMLATCDPLIGTTVTADSSPVPSSK